MIYLMEMSRFIVILIVFSFFACSNKSKNTPIAQEVKSAIMKRDSLQNKEADLAKTSKNNRGQFIKDIPFYTELVSKLNSKEDTVYIGSRHSLDKFKTIEKQDSIVILKYKQYEITIKSKDFNRNKHSLDLVDTVWKSNAKVDYLKAKNLIDGKKAYGIDGNVPNTELSEFRIKVNQEVIQLPDKYFCDNYNVNLQNTEAYLSSDSSFIYVYISGSDAAGSYSTKYVLDKNGYTTRIVTEYCGFDFIDGISYDCF